MYTKSLIVALALAAPALATVPLLLQNTVTSSGVTSVVGTTTLLSGPAALGLFSLVGIAAAVGIGAALREGRGKRSTNTLSTDASFAIISNLEPAQCYRRLICDVASGKMAADDSNELILAPFAGVSNTYFRTMFSFCKITNLSDFRLLMIFLLLNSRKKFLKLIPQHIPLNTWLLLKLVVHWHLLKNVNCGIAVLSVVTNLKLFSMKLLINL